MMRRALVVIALAIIGAACGSDDSTNEPSAADGTVSPEPGSDEQVAAGSGSELVTSEGFVLPPSPDVQTGATSPDLLSDLDALFAAVEAGLYDVDLLIAVGTHGDVRAGWVLADLLRFAATPQTVAEIATTFEELAGIELSEPEETSPWKSINDHLIGWDVPALDEYVTYKARIFTRLEPAWVPFFADSESTIDWRFVTWGGVLIDDGDPGSPLGCSRGCIPALDDPAVTDADEGDWYPDDAIVFGVQIGGEARAYPKNIMEVHEMINDTIGGRRIGMPYCTLCGSAQVYFTDSVPDGVEMPVLRTSGLLIRSNKVMYDLVTSSVFDTFTGEARSGPLREAGVVLEQGTVVASTWAGWKDAHPDTTIIAADGGIGRVYPLDPLGGRDDDGPIFPVGNVDGRLDVQAPVIGVIAPDGTPVAFPAVMARTTLEAGGLVEAHDVSLALDGDGLRATTADGTEVAAHQSFWFAWSQFHTDTEVWPAG